MRGTGVLLDPVYTISGKFLNSLLNGQKLTRIRLSFTRDPRSRVFCSVPCKRLALVKNSSVRKFPGPV